MDSHTAGRTKAAWRERNEGAEAPGDGQNVPRYYDPLPTVDQPENVGAPVTDSHVETELVAEVDPTVDWPRATGNFGMSTSAHAAIQTEPELYGEAVHGSPEPAGLSAENAPALVKRPPGRPRKT